jgi:arylformamidase
MKSTHTVLVAGLAALALATPIMAQRESGDGKRLSRKCLIEVVQLCGRDRSQIPSCVQQYSETLSKKCRREVTKRIAERGAPPPAPLRPYQRTARPTQTLIYGSHQRQAIDVYEPEGAVEERPMVLFIHGGAWQMGSHKRVQSKPVHFNSQNIFFASAGYRVLPDTPVEDQAKDVGLALQALIAQADPVGFDPTKVVLMGHSAGAHLAALVATDPQYAGEAFGSIAGVVLLDGAGYDVAKNMKDAPFERKRIYEDAFGILPERHKALSPVTHVGGKDAPRWLALYVEDRAVSKAQAETLVGLLASSGRDAKAIPISDTDHGLMNREIGTETGKAQTEAIDAFLAGVF